MKMCRIVQLTLLIAFAASIAVAQDKACPTGSRGDCQRAIEFFHLVRAELQKNDRLSLAAQIEYPLLTSIHHKRASIRSKEQFLKQFDQIFDKGVRCAILNASDDDIWSNSRGYTLGNGDIWFDDLILPGKTTDPKAPGFWSKGTFKIMTVNNDSQVPCKSGIRGES